MILPREYLNAKRGIFLVGLIFVDWVCGCSGLSPEIAHFHVNTTDMPDTPDKMSNEEKDEGEPKKKKDWYIKEGTE